MKKSKTWSKVSILIVTILIISGLLSSMNSFAQAEKDPIDIKITYGGAKGVSVFTEEKDSKMGVFCIESGKSADSGKFSPVRSYDEINNTQKYIFAKYFDLIEHGKYNTNDIKQAIQLLNWNSLGAGAGKKITGAAKELYDMIGKLAAAEKDNIGKNPVTEASTVVSTKAIDIPNAKVIYDGNKVFEGTEKLKGYKFGPFEIDQLTSLGFIKEFYLEANDTRYTKIKVMNSSDQVIMDWQQKYLDYYKDKFYIYIDNGVIPDKDLDALKLKVVWGYSEATAVIYKQCAKDTQGNYVISNGQYKVTANDKQKVVKINATPKTVDLTFGFKAVSQEFDLTLNKYGVVSYNSDGTVRERQVLPGTMFRIESTAISGTAVTKTTDSDGKIFLDKLQGFGDIEFKITELFVSGSYVKNGTIVLKVHRYPDGTISQVGDITMMEAQTDSNGNPLMPETSSKTDSNGNPLIPDTIKAPCIVTFGVNKMDIKIDNTLGEFRIKKIDSVTGREIIGTPNQFEFSYKATYNNLSSSQVNQKLVIDTNGYATIAYPFSEAGVIDFEIFEMSSPAGYAKLQGTIKFRVQKTADGRVNLVSNNFDEINRINGFTEKNKKVDIGDIRVSGDGKGVSVSLVVPNIPQNTGLGFKLIKTDTSGMVLSGAEFDITCDAFVGNRTITRTTDRNGYIDLTSYLNQSVYGNITFIIDEKNPPTNYNKIGNWGTRGKVITINRDKNGNITIVQDSNYNTYFRDDSFASARVDYRTQLTLTIQNKYKSQSGSETLSGYVWLQESKTDTNTNYVLDSGDIRLEKVKVSLYREGYGLYNTTTTDVNGQYYFSVEKGYWIYDEDGNPVSYIKYKYYTIFEYNGEEYVAIPRVSDANKMQANSSKSIETAADRKALNDSLKLITSSNGRNNNAIRSYITEVTTNRPQVPVYNDVTTVTAKSYTYEAGAESINLGLMRRPKANLALLKDIVDVTFKINGKTETYKYDLKIDAAGNEYFEVEPKDNDIIYAIGRQVQVNDRLLSTIKQNGEISTEDYLRESDERYRMDTYSENNPANGSTESSTTGTHASVLGVAESNELTIDLRYRITVKNTGSVPAAVKELVDYYDASQMKLTEVRDEAGNLLASDFRAETYGDYQKNFIELLNKIVLEPNGKSQTLYFTFRLTKNDARNLLIADKNNYAEISSFTAYIPATYENTIKYVNGASLNIVTNPYLPEKDLITKECIREWVRTWETTTESGTNRMVFGRRDMNSVPGNYMPELEYKETSKGIWSAVKNGVTYYYEDDNDAAPVFRIKVMDPDKNRKLNGNVWEDLRQLGLDRT